jgi:hypothetical protein
VRPFDSARGYRHSQSQKPRLCGVFVRLRGLELLPLDAALGCPFRGSTGARLVRGRSVRVARSLKHLPPPRPLGMDNRVAVATSALWHRTQRLSSRLQPPLSWELLRPEWLRRQSARLGLVRSEPTTASVTTASTELPEVHMGGRATPGVGCIPGSSGVPRRSVDDRVRDRRVDEMETKTRLDAGSQASSVCPPSLDCQIADHPATAAAPPWSGSSAA